MNFDAASISNEIVDWIKNWFNENGNDCNAIVGISGGKDSSVTAALCVKALGRARVTGVLMPNGVQHDIDVALALCAHLGISYCTINIKDSYDSVMLEVGNALGTVSEQTKINLAPRLRMTSLYAVSQSLNGRVANTCNLSEDYVGYSTRYGDSAGDFSPLSHFTVAEVKAIGSSLGLPDMFIQKVPSDGISGKTDEDNLGFTYAVLDNYIRNGVCNDPRIKEKIDRMHAMNRFKVEPMPAFEYNP